MQIFKYSDWVLPDNVLFEPINVYSMTFKSYQNIQLFVC